jgi:hypothetical protein
VPQPEIVKADTAAQTAAPALPQTQPSAGNPAVASDQKQGQSKDKDSEATAGTSKDRLFFALPNFLTLENAGQVPPLTTGQKYKVVAQGSFDPIQAVWYGALSGISQAENSEPGF